MYADANSSYDVPNAIRIGKLMEQHGYAFFEEPCPFDHLWETREVARMANAAGMPCTVHMSGGGLGYIDACHLASCIDDPGPFQEFKGTSNVPIECDSSTLRPQRGEVTVPTGPGYGITIDPEYIRKSELMSR